GGNTPSARPPSPADTAQHPAELGQAPADQEAREDGRLDVPQVGQEGRGQVRGGHDGPAAGDGVPGARVPRETVALKQPRSRSPPRATKLAIGRAATRPRGEVPQVTHRSQKTCAVVAQPDTGSIRVVPVHSLRTFSRLPTDRYGSGEQDDPASRCSQ